jgi:hypothetical protein
MKSPGQRGPGYVLFKGFKARKLAFPLPYLVPIKDAFGLGVAPQQIASSSSALLLRARVEHVHILKAIH